MPNIRWLLALITRVHRWMYLTSGGRVGGNIIGMRMLLLHHVGRKTGLVHMAPLLYILDGDRFVVVASNSGDDRDPAWWLNLQAHPEAAIQVGRQRISVKARVASPGEDARLWPVLVDSFRYYDRYREGTDREIPMVVLERTA